MDEVNVLLAAEHMLFYASEKYPKEGMYKKFLSEVLNLISFLLNHDLEQTYISYTGGRYLD